MSGSRDNVDPSILQGDADLPCSICGSAHWTRQNDIIRCHSCKVVVHQDCYGSREEIKSYDWYCKKCVPYSQIRSSKVKCGYCPKKDGALKPTNDKNEHIWCHILCALYIPELKFNDSIVRDLVDVAALPPPASTNRTACVVCSELGKGADAAIGVCIACDQKGCTVKFHATCGQSRGLLHERTVTSVLGDPSVTEKQYFGFCPRHNLDVKKKDKVKGSAAKPGHNTAKGSTDVKGVTNNGGTLSVNALKMEGLKKSSDSHGNSDGLVIPVGSLIPPPGNDLLSFTADFFL